MFKHWQNLQTVTLLIPEMVERPDGGARPNWKVEPTEVEIGGVIVQPSVTSSTEPGRDDHRTTLQIWMDRPAGDFPRFARMRIPSYPGRDFDIVGEPLDWQSPVELLDHVTLKLERVEG